MLVSRERFLTARFPMPERRAEVTRILQRDGGSESELLPLVYAELKGIAASRMRGERSDHTLQATALVHEAYVPSSASTASSGAIAATSTARRPKRCGGS